jgi:hypothetical protein
MTTYDLIHVVTLVLDGMPFIPYHLPMLQMTNLDWHWHIVHGAAMNNGSTSWCAKQEPRLSLDGTTEYLAMIKSHPRVTIYERPDWGSKDEMVNEPLKHIKEECVLMQIDVDEIWQAWQLNKIVSLFQAFDGKANAQPRIASMEFACRYFLGVDIVSTTPNSYGNNHNEWLRAWRFVPGDKFDRHEPPQLNQKFKGQRWVDGKNAIPNGLTFDHHAWMFEHQAAYKERFYSYPNALACWRRLQANDKWPV